MNTTSRRTLHAGDVTFVACCGALSAYRSALEMRPGALETQLGAVDTCGSALGAFRSALYTGRNSARRRATAVGTRGGALAAPSSTLDARGSALAAA